MINDIEFAENVVQDVDINIVQGGISCRHDCKKLDSSSTFNTKLHEDPWTYHDLEKKKLSTSREEEAKIPQKFASESSRPGAGANFDSPPYKHFQRIRSKFEARYVLEAYYERGEWL